MSFSSLTVSWFCSQDLESWPSRNVPQSFAQKRGFGGLDGLAFRLGMGYGRSPMRLAVVQVLAVEGWPSSNKGRSTFVDRPLVAKRSDYRPRSAPLESPTQSASPVRALGTDDSPCRVSRADESDAEANAARAWSSAPPSSRGGKRQYFPPIESVPGGKAPPIDPWIAANAPGGTGVNAAPRQGARVVSARPTRVSSGASASAAAALTAPRTLAMRTARRTISSWPSREPVPFESATRVPGTALRRRRRRRR